MVADTVKSLITFVGLSFPGKILDPKFALLSPEMVRLETVKSQITFVGLSFPGKILAPKVGLKC